MGASHALLTVHEVAAQLGVSTATVYKLCDQGELVHVRVSNAIRIAPADLRSFVFAARTTKQSPPREKSDVAAPVAPRRPR